MIPRVLVAFLAVGVLGTGEARAEYRQVDLSIYGMD